MMQLLKQEIEILDIINSVQEDIVNNCNNDYYADRYKDVEKEYWEHIRKWIYMSRGHQIKNCLDIGAGYGTLLLYAKEIHNCELYGIDFTDRYLSDSLKNKHSINFELCNIELDKLPWNEKFDMILLTEVVEHFNFNLVPTLKKIHNSLNDNGTLYISTPDASKHGKITKYYKDYRDMPEPFKGNDLLDEHVYVFYRHELEDIFKEVGFRVEKARLTTCGNFNFELKKINLKGEN